MNILKSSVLFIFILFFPVVLFGQNKATTSQNFYLLLNEAESKTEKQIRKKVKIQKLFSNGEITKTLTDTTEYLPPDKSRWIALNVEGKVVNRIEQIRVGDFYYRKEDNGEWVKRRVDEDGMGLGGGLGGITDDKREYFIKEAKIGKEKFQVLIEKWINYNKTYFDERKIWINKKGLIVKRTSTTSHLELQNIVSSVEETVDYSVKAPKIEAPIK